MSVNCTERGVEPEVGVAVKEAVGVIGETFTHVVCVLVLLPAIFEAVRFTDQFPTPKVCVAFWTIEVFPSPNTQYQEVGEFNEVSLNCTASGTTPEVVLAVKEATGGTVYVMFNMGELVVAEVVLKFIKYE